MTQQLPLPITVPAQNTFERFVAGGNGELIARLRRPVQGFECLWLHGAPGVGKTHLLHAACHAHPAASYIPAREIAPSAGLDGYGGFALVGIDDISRWIGERAAELACIALYNTLSRRTARLLLTCDRAPRALSFALPDLASRLRAASCYRVEPLGDADCAELVRRVAAERGLGLGADVLHFLLLRTSRDQRELLRILDRLDALSLAAKRRITVPFVKKALGL